VVLAEDRDGVGGVVREVFVRQGERFHEDLQHLAAGAVTVVLQHLQVDNERFGSSASNGESHATQTSDHSIVRIV